MLNKKKIILLNRTKNREAYIWKDSENKMFEHVYASGSGSNTFLSITNQEAQFISSHQKGDVNHAFQTNVCLVARLLAIERVTNSNLKESWGGGFESIYYNGSSFTKMNDMAYLICEGKFDEDGNVDIPVPSLILYYQYYRDILIITSIELKNYERRDSDYNISFTSTREDYRISYFVVQSIDGENNILMEELNEFDFSFTTHNIAMGYAIRTKSNVPFIPAFFDKSMGISVSYQHNGVVQVTLNKDICNELVAGVKKVFPNLKD